MDPLRVTVGVYDLGVSGYEADDFIYMDQRVVSELSGSRFVTLPFSPGTCKEHVNRLILAFKHLSSSSFIQHNTKNNGRAGVDLEPWSDIKMKLTPREAFFAKKKKVDIKDAIGKICGELICPFSPGFPILSLGEVISDRVIDTLQQSIVDGAKVIGSFDPLLSSILICDV
uniref:Arginine decarboxylase n=1 Tax=Chenopodium quinoa TaxID=63459 RepID=A0A803LZ19_CHEQI